MHFLLNHYECEQKDSIFLVRYYIILGSIRISYAASDSIEHNVNAGGAHGPSRISDLAV